MGKGSRKKMYIAPDPRSGHSMTVLKNFLVVYGGFNNAHYCLYDCLWYFDILRDRWRKRMIDINLQRSCSFSEIVGVDSRLFIFGCKGFPFGESILNILSNYDLETKKWKILCQQSSQNESYDNIPLYVSYIFHYQNSIYVFAGTLGNITSNAIFRFCLKVKKWERLSQRGNLPHSSCQIHGCVYGDKFYYFGDSDVFMPNQFYKVHVLDLKTLNWVVVRTIPDGGKYPCERINGSMTFNSTHGYLSGGMLDSKDKIDDIWSFDLRCFRWKLLDVKLHTGLMLHTSCIYQETTLYIFGGVTNTDVRVNELQKFYIEPPSLFHLSRIVAVRRRGGKKRLDELPQDMMLKLEIF